MEIVFLIIVGVAAWYLWPKSASGQAAPISFTSPVVIPTARSGSPTADDAITALTVVRDRLVLLNAPPEKIEAVLALAPALLAKEGAK